MLPDELCYLIFDLLDSRSLCVAATISRWTHYFAVPLIWRSVELVDRRHEYVDDEDESKTLTDDHDDIPIIERLVVLARYATKTRQAIDLSKS